MQLKDRYKRPVGESHLSEANESANGSGNVLDFIEAFSAAWRSGEHERVLAFLHPAVVFVSPTGDVQLRGADAAATSYVDFVRQATIDRYAEQPPTVHFFGEAAMASYAWEMTWSLQGDVYTDSGRDQLLLVRGGAHGWTVAWRSLWPL